MHIRHFLLLSIAVLATACVPHAGQPLATSSTPDPESLSDYATLGAMPEHPQHQLDATIRPTALHGSAYVGIGADNEVYLVDWASGQQTQLTSDGLAKTNAVFSEDYVAWIAYTRLADQEPPLTHIAVLDRRTGKVRTITAGPAPRVQLVLDGHRLAWADKRNELDAHYTAYDLYAYDLATHTEIAVAVAPGAQHDPSLSGDRLVWVDNRDSPERDGNLAGCGNCPENRFDLYLYEFTAQTTRVLAAGEALRASPTIAGDRVAWVGFSDVLTTFSSGTAIGPADIYLLDLTTGVTRRVTHTPQSESWPMLAGDRLLWTVRKDCDVVEVQVGTTPTPPSTGVYVLDIATNYVQQLTDYVEPAALLDNGAALIIVGCMTGFGASVVPLD